MATSDGPPISVPNVTLAVSRAASLVGGGFVNLAAGHYVRGVPWTATAYASQTAASTAETVIHPRPDSEASSFARHRWAHSDFDYQIPIAIRGGSFPYNLEVDTQATSAAIASSIVLGVSYNSTNPYTVTIPAATIAGLSTLTDYTVQIKATDQEGKELKVSWSFQKEAAALDHFFFVDKTATAGGDGSFSSPFNNILEPGWLASGNAESSAQKVLVIKEGNSQLTPYSKTSGDWNISPTAFPSAIIGMPGQRPKVDLNHTIALYGLGLNSDDVFVGGLEVINGRDAAGQTGDARGAFNNCFNQSFDRHTVWDCIFDTVRSWGSGTVNPGALKFEGNITPRKYLAVVDCEFKNFAGTTELNSGAPIHLMSFQYAVFDNCKCTNVGGDNGDLNGAAGMVYFKHAISDVTVRRWTATNNNYWRRGIVVSDDTTSATGANVANMEICYNNLDNEDDGHPNWCGLPGTNNTGDGPHYVFRNTSRSGNVGIAGDSVGSELRGNAWTGTDSSTITFGVNANNYPSESRFNADGTLTDNFYTTESSQRGTVGHEIA